MAQQTLNSSDNLPTLRTKQNAMNTELYAADAAGGDVPSTRLINTTSPITGGGNLSADRTIAHANSAVTPGSYTSADITVDAKGHITAADNGTGGGGSSAAWDSVRAATTANITLSGAQTIDGVSVVAGDRVLVKNQITTAQNGIYVVATGAWTRATDANSAADFAVGKMVEVREGTVYRASIQAQSTTGTITPGTSPVEFWQVGGDASEDAWGIVRTATQAEVDAGTSGTDIVVTPEKLAAWTGATIPDASTTVKGKVELATDAETQTGTDTARAITPANLSARSATETRTGVAEIATQTETDTGTDDVRIVTALKAATRYLAKAGGTLTGFLTLHADPSSAMHAVTKQYADALVVGGASPASETVAGIAEIATQVETDAGTDDARIVTPLKLANYSGLGGGSSRTLVTLGSDVTGSATANAFADVTGLSFAVVSGTIYRFEAHVIFDAPAATTGSKWAISGPASPTMLAYTATWPASTTASSTTHGNAYDLGASSSASAFTSSNLAVIRGIINPSASGTVIIRFASELGSSAIVAKAGSTLEYW